MKREAYKNSNDGSLRDIDAEELDAFLSQLILAAALKDNHLSTKIIRKQHKKKGKKETKLAAISDIWEVLVEQCKLNYKPSSYVTIDEQLVGFRGKCSFRMYIPSKLNKF